MQVWVSYRTSIQSSVGEDSGSPNFLEVMDLSLWDPPEDQGYLTSYQSNDYTEDHLLCDFPFGYGRDMMEEEALNEKYCLQVLKILMDEADEKLVELEEDIMMLQCQLTWDDEVWSKPCSAALESNIDHLDTLIQSLQKETIEDVHNFGLCLEPQRLHDLPKSLQEDYLSVKIEQDEQTETSIIQMPVELSKEKSEASASKDNKKMEKKECTNMVETSEMKSQSLELEKRKLNHQQQKKDAVISKFNASGHKRTTDKLSEKETNKPNRLQRRRMPKSAPVKSGRRSFVKSQPSNPVVKASSVNMSTKKATSTERREKRDNDKEVISKAKVSQCGLEHESKVTNSETQISEIIKSADEILDSKVDCMKQKTEASRKAQKPGLYRYAINKNVLSTKPSVKMKRKRTQIPGITLALEAQKNEIKNSVGSSNDRTKHAREAKMNLKPKIQVQQRHEIEALKQAKSFSSLKPKGQGPQKKCKASPEIVQNSSPAENIDMGSPSTENLKGQQKYGVLEKISENGKKESQQQPNANDIDSASEVTVTEISSPHEVKELSSRSQTLTQKKDFKNVQMNLAKMEQGTSNSSTEEARDSVEDMCQNSFPRIKDVERLTLKDLKVIARNEKLAGYSKLRKADLQKRLGFEPLYLRQKIEVEKKEILPENTI